MYCSPIPPPGDRGFFRLIRLFRNGSQNGSSQDPVPPRQIQPYLIKKKNSLLRLSEGKGNKVSPHTYFSLTTRTN